MSIREADQRDFVTSLVGKEAYELTYQPIIDLENQAIESLEVLVRFSAPAAFTFGTERICKWIEDFGIHSRFDLGIINRALLALHKIGDHRSLSINLCASTLSDEYFLIELDRVLARHRAEPSRIKFEITENSLLSNLARQHTIPELHSRGFQLVIDDFISGYSNFGALTDPHIRTVKVDRSVTEQLNDSEIARRFLRSLHTLTESLGKKVVVEGVENAAQYFFIHSIGYRLIQGYLLGKPMNHRLLTRYLKTFHRIQLPTVFDLTEEVFPDIGHAQSPGSLSSSDDEALLRSSEKL